MRTTTTILALSALLAATLATHAEEDPVNPQSGNPPRYTYGGIVKSNLPPMPADWKNPERPWVEPADPRHIHPESRQQIVPLEDRYLAKPLVDEPMRSPSICRGPDGTFYLIGATPRKMEDGSLNWDYGNAIKMWKSADLKSWESLGAIWDLNTPKWTPEHGHTYGWVWPPRGGGYADSYRHTWNVTGPRLYYLRDTFWIAFSVGDRGTGLLKSTSGKAEGPYILWGKEERTSWRYSRITTDGANPSLFVDDDGAAYWLWGSGLIAKMKDDLTGLAEPPRQLTCEPRYEGDIFVGRRGFTLFKANGIYHLAAAELLLRLGMEVEDTLVATSKELFGRYSKREQMIKHSGPISVFQDGAGKYWATVCGSDRYAAVRDRAGIVPLEWITQVGHTSWPQPGILMAHPQKVFTERGPWHKMLPLFVKPGLHFRDHHVTQGADGYFYVSGSVHGHPYAGKLTIYRSRDLKEWEEILVRTFEEEEELPPETRQIGKNGNFNFSSADYSKYYMSTAVNWVPKLKTFAINYETLNSKITTSGLLLSTTGRGEGPYKRVAPGFNTGKFLQDDDGRFYMAWGINNLMELNDDFTVKAELPCVRPRSGAGAVEDCNCSMVKMFGKYIFCTITYYEGFFYEYGYAHMQADKPAGPWGEWMPGLRHCAWGQPFRGLDGHWYASSFSDGNCAGLTPLCIYIIRLKTEFRDGQVLMDIDPDWTPDDYKPVTGWKGQGEFSPYTDTAPGPKQK